MREQPDPSACSMKTPFPSSDDGREGRRQEDRGENGDRDPEEQINQSANIEGTDRGGDL